MADKLIAFPDTQDRESNATSSSFIETLPPEILLQILRFVVQYHTTILHQHTYPARLLRTSRHWHDIIVSDPSLWSNIVVPAGSDVAT